MRCKLVLRFYRQLQSYKEILIWQSIMLRNIKRLGKRVSLVGASVKGDGRVMALEADAGDAAAGDLVGREGLAVFIGEVTEAVRLGGLFQPVDESFHLGVDDLLCASEADADDYECHVGDSEMAF